jgi:hypothetical protein
MVVAAEPLRVGQCTDDVARTEARAALAGGLIAPATLGLLIALPFLAPFALPRGDAPHPTTDFLVNHWTWLKYAGGAIWGIALGWITSNNVVRLGAAGLLAMVVADSIVFGPLSAALAPLFPITLADQPHVEMAVTFPFAAATSVMVTGIAFAIAAGKRRLVPVLTIGAAVAAAAAVILSVMVLDAFGVRTGTGALAMPKVFVFGTFAATAVVGAIQASALSRLAH